MEMEIPEYLDMFSGEGIYTVSVKFEEKNKSISTTKCSPSEIEKLINPINGDFYDKIYFDEHLLPIYKIYINKLKKL